MPHNVYTGDEEGRVVRFSFFSLKQWALRKMGCRGQVELRAGKSTKVIMSMQILRGLHGEGGGELQHVRGGECIDGNRLRPCAGTERILNPSARLIF